MSSLKRFFFIIALTMMWSPSFLFIKWAVREIPPLTTVAMRTSLASIILFSILYIKKTTLPKNRMFWVHSAVMGFFASVLPFYLFCYAEQTIDSALAAILNGSTPMYTALMAHYFIPSDSLNRQKVIGIILSLAGLILLFLPNIVDGLSGNLMGMIAGAVAAVCYAISHIYGKKFMMQQKPFVAPAAQILLSACMLAPLALLFENPFQIPTPSLTAFGGVMGLACLGTACAFILYYKLLEISGPTSVSMVACLFPAGGMLLGFLFLDERFGFAEIIASSMILLGIVIVNNVLPLKFLQPKVVPEKIGA